MNRSIYGYLRESPFHGRVAGVEPTAVNCRAVLVIHCCAAKCPNLSGLQLNHNHTLTPLDSMD